MDLVAKYTNKYETVCCFVEKFHLAIVHGMDTQNISHGNTTSIFVSQQTWKWLTVHGCMDPG